MISFVCSLQWKFCPLCSWAGALIHIDMYIYAFCRCFYLKILFYQYVCSVRMKPATSLLFYKLCYGNTILTAVFMGLTGLPCKKCSWSHHRKKISNIVHSLSNNKQAIHGKRNWALVNTGEMSEFCFLWSWYVRTSDLAFTECKVVKFVTHWKISSRQWF